MKWSTGSKIQFWAQIPFSDKHLLPLLWSTQGCWVAFGYTGQETCAPGSCKKGFPLSVFKSARKGCPEQLGNMFDLPNSFSTPCWVHENEACWHGRCWPSEPAHSTGQCPPIQQWPWFPHSCILNAQNAACHTVDSQYMFCGMNGDRNLATWIIKGKREKLGKRGQTRKRRSNCIDQSIRIRPWVFIMLCMRFSGLPSGKILLI